MDRSLARVIRAFSGGIPLVARPYLEMGRRAGLGEKELLELVDRYLREGIIRRIGVAVDHYRTGYRANALVALVVPKERVEGAGRLVASLPEVSHCYERASSRNWPYNLYAMVHGLSREEVQEVGKSIARAARAERYTILYTLEELKKTSLGDYLVYLAENDSGSGGS